MPLFFLLVWVLSVSLASSLFESIGSGPLFIELSYYISGCFFGGNSTRGCGSNPYMWLLVTVTVVVCHFIFQWEVFPIYRDLEFRVSDYFRGAEADPLMIYTLSCVGVWPKCLTVIWGLLLLISSYGSRCSAFQGSEALEVAGSGPLRRE